MDERNLISFGISFFPFEEKTIYIESLEDSVTKNYLSYFQFKMKYLINEKTIQEILHLTLDEISDLTNKLQNKNFELISFNDGQNSIIVNLKFVIGMIPEVDVNDTKTVHPEYLLLLSNGEKLKIPSIVAVKISKRFIELE